MSGKFFLSWMVACGSVAMIGLPAPAARAQSYLVTHYLTGGNTGGDSPTGALIALNGLLYGTTEAGGGDNLCGTVFSIKPGGRDFTVLYDFPLPPPGQYDGCSPMAGLTDTGGALYGTTVMGGRHGYGSVFAISPAGTEMLVHSFAGAGGEVPYGGVIYANGLLYGTTTQGGTDSAGIVYSMTLDGQETVLHSFTLHGNGGVAPEGNLIYSNGKLFGTTYEAGAHGAGAVYALDAAGSASVTVLHAFTGGTTDGADPEAGLLESNGAFYGTTAFGGAHNFGTLFRIMQDGNYKTIYNFSGASDGANPEAPLTVANGVLFGTTYSGGASSCGTVFSFSLVTGVETVLHSFADGSSDGCHPVAALLPYQGHMFGSTFSGGQFDLGLNRGAGVLFAITH